MFLNECAVKHLRELCQDYRARSITLENFASSLWQVSQEISSLEEKELRKFLMESEAHLDSLSHTTNAEVLFDKSLEVIDLIESKLDSVNKENRL